MNSTRLIRLVAVAAGAVLLAACGGSDHPPQAPPTAQMLSTAQVVTLATASSESAEPFAVADGAVTLRDDDDEHADPVAVNTP